MNTNAKYHKNYNDFMTIKRTLLIKILSQTQKCAL